MAVSPEAVLRFALAQAGDTYQLGAEASSSDANPTVFDCSELVEWACARAGVQPTMPDLTWNQQLHCEQAGKLISVQQAIGTRGALLFKHRDGSGNPVSDMRTFPTDAHVAFSLGNGRTIEAMGTQWGVCEGNANRASWTAGGLIPGVDYGLKEPPTTVPAGKAPAANPGTTSPSGKLRLVKGSTGAEVKELQQMLESIGVDRLPHYSLTGQFTDLTDLAIRLVQQHVKATYNPNMLVDGDCGPVTWGWVGFLASAGPNDAPPAGGPAKRADLASVKQGAPSGDAVKQLQQALVNIGTRRLPSLAPTGDFGTLTDLGVRLFQWHIKTAYDSAMDVDGIVGPITWGWLKKLSATPASV